MKDSISVGYIDEVVAKEDLMQGAMDKANELASLPHPYYANTKKFAQHDTVAMILSAIQKYESRAGLK